MRASDRARIESAPRHGGPTGPPCPTLLDLAPASASIASCCLTPGRFAKSSAAFPPDVVLITIDTLRADRVGVYGPSPGDAQPRPVGAPGCHVRRCDRARAAHAAIARVDPHGPIPDGPPRQRQRRGLRLPARSAHTCGDPPCTRLPYGSVRLILCVESQHRPGPRLRHVRRPLRSGGTAPVTVEPSAAGPRGRARRGRVAHDMRRTPSSSGSTSTTRTRRTTRRRHLRGGSPATVRRRDRDERLGAG